MTGPRAWSGRASGRLRGSPDGGFTLVELLLAVAILGLGVLTVVGGMMTSILVSDLGRRSADGQGALRAYAEAVANDTYSSCATTYPAAGFSAPTGFTTSLTVSYWVPSSTSFATTCPATDAGLQRIRLTLTATDGRGTESVVVAKRRRPAGEP
jgi:prepilin-type N-terminal cleavage/methylation domain-containing protein